MARRLSNLELVKRVGEAVHGPYWQKSLAEDLNINRRTINRWLQGDTEVSEVMPDGMPLTRALLAIVLKHEKRLVGVKVQLLKILDRD